ncbi:FTR1 family protein [uncultured Thalassospira sp.]|uniref:FTR1 family iron permease n=1 Tax=uncultured Thalassospira sp. TaxID=404382 RepID=UPI0030DC5C5A|tara:strand:+ start:308 stop:1150 length:843 start_codon:yes stop_codon:yes gene_type:complete
MSAALIIVFREVLEAALIVGIVLAAVNGVQGARRWIVAGIAGGIAGAAIVAYFAGAIAGALAGYGQEIFNAAILLIAVLMLGWHNAWMSVHGREMAMEMRDAGNAVRNGQKSLSALAIVVGVAVLREGSEIVLFLYGLAMADGGLSNTLIGGGIGLAAGVVVGAAMYLGLLRIPTRYLFSVTSIMITLLAAGMAAQAMNFLSAADILDLGPVLWDSSWLLSQDSLVGKALHTLVGYMDRPTLTQIIAYLVTIIVITLASKISKRAAAQTARPKNQPSAAE